MDSPTLQVRLSLMRTYVTTPKFSQVAPFGGKGKRQRQRQRGTFDKIGGGKGDLLIQYLWMQGTYSIHNMRVVNTDTVSYQYKTPEKCLETTDHKKRKKYLHACLNEHLYVTPFVASTDDLIRVKAEATLKRIASRLALCSCNESSVSDSCVEG